MNYHQTLVADRVFIASMRSDIEGVFNITDKINLNTQDGHIKATVNMESDGLSQSSAGIFARNGYVVLHVLLIFAFIPITPQSREYDLQSDLKCG